MKKPPPKRRDFVVPSGIQAARCKACGARIFWVMNPTTERRAPLDFKSAIRVPKTDPEGNPIEGEFETRAESHFAHCAQPQRFRRPRRR